LKGAATVTQYADFTFSPLALNGFPAVTVAAVTTVVALGTVLFIAEVLIHLRFELLLQRPCEKRLQFGRQISRGATAAANQCRELLFLFTQLCHGNISLR
jgi:hypothetical protein